ncbi:MAG TPA: fasciclin domain-containing protein [Anaerolineales bacterium]|nr:fasciclin domain-containing protein [Anaerolineales bacterium]
MKGLCKFVSALLIAVFALGAFAPATQAQETDTIVDAVLAANAETGEFSILIDALQAANPDVIRRLSGEREFTVFAPTDAAFTALLGELGLTAEELLGNRPLLSRVLRYHLVRGELESEEVLARDRIQTVQGGRVLQEDGILTDANDRTATIVETDIQAGNGIIHVIDNVLLPRPMNGSEERSIVDVVTAANEETGEFSILLAALQAANPDVIRRLSGEREFTVFAPTDDAFTGFLEELGLTADELLGNRSLLSRVLRYHLVRGELESDEVLAMDRIRTVQGGRVFQEDGVLTDQNDRTATLIEVDIQARNGIIHVIDNVLLPRPMNGSEQQSIVDVVTAANAETGEFSILIAALQAADPEVLELLSGDQEYTVFAPTDDAFTGLLEELGLTADELLADTALLSRVLRYHVVSGELTSEEVLASTSLQTVEGGSLSQSAGVLTDANNRTATIIEVDIQASNGVIHVIDNVVLPDLND